MASDIINVSLDDLFYGYDYNDSYANASYEDCCDGGDICDLNETTRFEAVFVPVLYTVAFIVGILGNGVLLGVLAQSRRTWSVTDTFILHLGVADILLLVTLPLKAAQAAQTEGWSFGNPLCKITGSLFTINFYCGIFLLACISLDRYLSIVHATQMYSRRKPWVVQLSCMAVWGFSLLLSIPDWIFLEVVSDGRRGRAECVSNFRVEDLRVWQLASRLLYHTVGFLLPSAVLIFCYSCILRRLRCGSHGLQKQKAFRVIVAVVVVFFICWTPFNITLMVDTLNSNSNNETCAVRSSLDKAVAITSSVGYLHCSLNPILYAFVGVKFRRQLKEILKSMGCKLKTGAELQSIASRRSSFWSESADTSKSIAIIKGFSCRFRRQCELPVPSELVILNKEYSNLHVSPHNGGQQLWTTNYCQWFWREGGCCRAHRKSSRQTHRKLPPCCYVSLYQRLKSRHMHIWAEGESTETKKRRVAGETETQTRGRAARHHLAKFCNTDALCAQTVVSSVECVRKTD